ncbi:MAG: ABC transporter substrate-binding protein [Tissierellia bacterium]|nr:ABC transporter substrate-binding protein [Tissierellia bacterium]
MKRQRIWALLLAIALLLSACSPAAQVTAPETERAAEEAITEAVTQAATEAAQTEKEETKADPDTEGTVSFTDSVGRTVEIPTQIKRLAPSGHLAQMILYSIDPDRLIGWGSLPNEIAQKYIPKEYVDLPEFGAFYGAKADLNVEALLGANPQIVIDLGQVKGDEMAAELDALQEQIGIPVIFIEAELDTMKEAYATLGVILQEEERTALLGNYVEETLEMAKDNLVVLTEEQKLKVFYGEGDTGLQTNPPQSIHAEVINLVGGINVAEMPQGSGAGMNEISIEQLLGWDPDVILFGPDSIFETVSEDPLWQEIRAVQEDKYYEIPIGPYNWMGRPPAVNRVLGIRWLGNLLYPDVFDYDMKEETKIFYDLFYRYELTDQEVEELLSRSTLKAE